MGQGGGVVEKKRATLVGAHPGKRILENQIRRIDFFRAAFVFGNLYALIIEVKLGWKIFVCLNLTVVAEEMIEAFFQRTASGIKLPHAPFARAGGGVTGGLENLRHGHRGLGQRKLARAER